MSSTHPFEDEPAAGSSTSAAGTHNARGTDNFTLVEAARLKGVSYHTVARAVRKNKLPAQRSGRLILISREDLAVWEPMRDRAPRSYRRRNPEPDVSPGVVDLASGERFELARRLSSLYESIQISALIDPIDDFARLIVERFAVAMEFDRVALWVIDLDRTEIAFVSSVGQWFAPGEEPLQQVRSAYAPAVMYVVPADVYPGIRCWMGTPAPVRMRDAFAASMVVNDHLIGYLIGDHNGDPFSLTSSQIELGQELATQAAITIELRRSRDLESQRLRELQEQTGEFADALSRLANAINEGQDLSTILRLAGRDATFLAGSHYGGVALQATRETVTCTWTIDGIDLPQQIYPVDLLTLSGTKRAFNEGRPLLVSWSDADARERSYLEAADCRSCLNLPFNVNGELAGAMMIKFRDEVPTLSPEQMHVIELLAAGCVTAITRQRLLDTLHDRSSEPPDQHGALSAAG